MVIDNFKFFPKNALFPAGDGWMGPPQKLMFRGSPRSVRMSTDEYGEWKGRNSSNQKH